jgi:rare lipoprotein A
MYAMTAAHPTLPLPSYVRVTNLANGRSVVVRVNDRGPFLHGRVIDLSYTAAARLGYVSQGSAQVEVEAIVPEGIGIMASRAPVASSPPPLPPVAPPARDPRCAIPHRRADVYLQLAAFPNLDNAENF